MARARRRDGLTHIVRRAANRSSATYTITSPPLHNNNASSARRFVLLVSAEPQPLHICTAPPISCHGLLPPFGRRYLRGLPIGTTLEAYEAVWGERWAPDKARGSRSSDAGRAARVLPHAQAGYAAAYEAHVARVASSSSSGKGAVRRLMSHLAQPALVCTLSSTAAAAASSSSSSSSSSSIGCSLSVKPHEFSELPETMKSSSSSSWRVYEITQVREIGQVPDVTFGAESSSSSSTSSMLPPPPTGKWRLFNHFEFEVLACELPDGASGEEDDITAASMALLTSTMRRTAYHPWHPARLMPNHL